MGYTPLLPYLFWVSNCSRFDQQETLCSNFSTFLAFVLILFFGYYPPYTIRCSRLILYFSWLTFDFFVAIDMLIIGVLLPPDPFNRVMICMYIWIKSAYWCLQLQTKSIGFFNICISLLPQGKPWLTTISTHLFNYLYTE